MVKYIGLLLTVFIILGSASSVNADLESRFIKSIPDRDYTPGETIPIELTIENTGLFTDEAFVEACIRPKGFTFSIPLSFFPKKDSCCPGNYWCDGGTIRLPGYLAPNNRETITLNPTIPDPSRGTQDNCGDHNFWDGFGEYEIVLVSANVCCVGPDAGDCQAAQPYGWGQVIKIINVVPEDTPPSDNGEPRCGDRVCEGGETANNCQSDCSPTPSSDPAKCGDRVCDSGLNENSVNCPSDCTANRRTQDVPNQALLWIEQNWMIVLFMIFLIIGVVLLIVL